MQLIRRLSIIATVTIAVTAAAAMPAAATAPTLSRVDTGQLIPLASLGGGESWAVQMNEIGDIVGGSTDARQDWRPAVWWHGRRSATALGVDRASPSAISDKGHIVGRLWDSGALFLWRRGTVTYLRKPTGTDLEVAAVNDRDQVVGTAYHQNGTSRAFLWQRGRFTLFPVPRGASSTAVDINNRGQIAGVVARRDAQQAALWQQGRMIELGTLGGSASTPVAINDRGQVIGNSTIKKSSAEHPFLWQHGRMTDLLAGTTARGGRVYDLSDTAMMTGSVDQGDGHDRPVLWRAGRMIELGVPGYSGIGMAVNDRGDVAGFSRQRMEGPAVPFRWRNGRTTYFPKPIPDIASNLIGINRHGTIAVEQETTSVGFTVLRSA